MTATTAVRRPDLTPRTRPLGVVSLPLLLSCVLPLVLALATGGWLRLLACIASVGAGAALVADGMVLGGPARPCQPVGEDADAGLEAAS